MSFLSRLSLANRSAVAIASLAIILLGIFIIPLLKQELLPSLSVPAISVVTSYPGASPTQVEQDVTDLLEQNIQGLQGIQNTASLSSEGSSLITITYSSDTDLAKAQQKLSERLTTIQANLPANVLPHLQTFNSNDTPIIDLALTSSQDLTTLSNTLKQSIVPALQGLHGVAAVTLTGVQQQIVTVRLDSQQLQNKGITLAQVQAALQANNLTMPAGEVAANGQVFAVRVGNALTSIQSLQDLVLGTQNSARPLPGTSLSGNTSTPIILGDVATIKEELAPASTLTRVNRQPALGISLTKAADGDTVAISQALKKLLPELEKRVGNTAHITIIDDQAPLIQSTIAELTHEGLLGAGFAILVILLFLFSLRSTLVIAISIPLSILIALIALWTQGYSLNALTLSGLTVAVGRVVDDSIVVLENIYRHLGLDRDKRTAVLTGVSEVAAAVTASTLTTVAVFLPLAFVGGTVGQQTAPLALTVTLALLGSLCVALTIIPVLAYWFLKTPTRLDAQTVNAGRPNILERAYTPLISWVTRHRGITVMLAILLLVGSFALFPLIPINFGQSTLTQNSFSFTQQLSPATSQEQINLAAQDVEAILAGTTGIQTYQTIVGTGTASFIVTTRADAATKSVELSVLDRLHKIADRVGTITFADQGGNIDVTVQASDNQTLKQATQQVFAALRQTPNTSDIRSNLAESVPLIDVHVDPTQAAQHGLTALQVGQLLQTIYSGTTVTHVVMHGVRQDLDLTFVAGANTVQAMQDMQLAGPLGTVRLGDIAAVAQVADPVQIVHTGGIRSATITLTPTGQNSGGVINAVQSRIATLKLPGDAQVGLGVNTAQIQDALTRLLLALLLAIPTVFIVMVVTFRSLIQPLILLVTIPFAAVGSLVLSALTQTAIGSSTLFGFLMLIGIVVTNAIVLIDRVNYYRAQGMDARAAVIAGGQHRVRPILMTALVTIIALIPMALSGTGNAIISSSLAIVVIGGLASSTFLTLLFVPTLYVIVENARDSLRKRRAVPLMQTEKRVAR